jgi:hypothetical protein
MRANAILLPVCALALWTSVVLFLTGFRRVRAVAQGRVPRNAFRLGEPTGLPAEVAVVNRNLMNLLEMPLLFYVLCLCLFVTSHVQRGLLVLAWVYVGLRLLHSLIHLTSNRVIHRLIVFTLSNIVLTAMWISFVRLLLV